jgi:hypothetical protein
MADALVEIPSLAVEACRWQRLCSSVVEEGPCTGQSPAPWRIGIDVYRFDLPAAEDCLPSLLKLVVTVLSPSSVMAPPEARVWAVLLDVVLAQPAVHRFAACPPPSEGLICRPALDPIALTSQRAAFMVSPRSSLFLDGDASLDGQYEALLLVARSNDAPPCIGIALDTVHLVGAPEPGEFTRTVQSFPFELEALAQERPDHLQFSAAVEKKQAYTSPAGWRLDEHAPPTISVVESVRADAPSVNVTSDTTLEVTGSARWTFLLDATPHLVNGRLRANVRVPLRRTVPDTLVFAGTLLTRRTAFCCCIPAQPVPSATPRLSLDISSRRLRLPAPASPPIDPGDGARQAAALRSELEASLTLGA